MPGVVQRPICWSPENNWANTGNASFSAYEGMVVLGSTSFDHYSPIFDHHFCGCVANRGVDGILRIDTKVETLRYRWSSAHQIWYQLFDDGSTKHTLWVDFAQKRHRFGIVLGTITFCVAQTFTVARYYLVCMVVFAIVATFLGLILQLNLASHVVVTDEERPIHAIAIGTPLTIILAYGMLLIAVANNDKRLRMFCTAWYTLIGLWPLLPTYAAMPPRMRRDFDTALVSFHSELPTRVLVRINDVRDFFDKHWSD